MLAKKISGHGQRGSKKRQKTIQKRQDPKKIRLITLLQDSPNIGVALKRVGIDRSTYSRWRTSDSAFARDVDEAIELGIENTADMVETSLLSKASSGDVQAQKYYLDHNHKRYRRWNDPEQENVLTDEMKKRIVAAIEGRGRREDDEDEREEDYGSGYDGSESETA